MCKSKRQLISSTACWDPPQTSHHAILHTGMHKLSCREGLECIEPGPNRLVNVRIENVPARCIVAYQVHRCETNIKGVDNYHIVVSLHLASLSQ
jgi:hypothetical protein